MTEQGHTEDLELEIADTEGVSGGKMVGQPVHPVLPGKVPSVAGLEGDVKNALGTEGGHPVSRVRV